MASRILNGTDGPSEEISTSFSFTGLNRGIFERAVRTERGLHQLHTDQVICKPCHFPYTYFDRLHSGKRSHLVLAHKKLWPHRRFECGVEVESHPSTRTEPGAITSRGYLSSQASHEHRVGSVIRAVGSNEIRCYRASPSFH